MQSYIRILIITFINTPYVQSPNDDISTSSELLFLFRLWMSIDFDSVPPNEDQVYHWKKKSKGEGKKEKESSQRV